MRNPQRLERLMRYGIAKRIFVMEVIKYVECEIEKHLYNDDSASYEEANRVKINLKDAFQSVFTLHFRGNQRVVVGWKSTLVESNTQAAVPQEFLNKCWSELTQDLVNDPYKVNLLSDWFGSVRHELEAMGYHVSQVYPYNEVMSVSWRRV